MHIWLVQQVEWVGGPCYTDVVTRVRATFDGKSVDDCAFGEDEPADHLLVEVELVHRAMCALSNGHDLFAGKRPTIRADRAQEGAAKNAGHRIAGDHISGLKLTLPCWHGCRSRTLDVPL